MSCSSVKMYINLQSEGPDDPNEELLTEYRISQLVTSPKNNKLLLDHESVEEGKSLQPEEKMGTVGAVALDALAICSDFYGRTRKQTCRTCWRLGYHRKWNFVNN